MKPLSIIVIAMALLLVSPAPVYACSGALDCLFGWSNRAEVRADRDAEIARIHADRDRAIADAEARQQQVIEQAQAEVERIKQQQFATEAERDRAIAETQARAEEYRAMIAALTDEKIAGINSNAQTQIAALQGQAQIAVAGITEAGQAERWRIAGAWVFSIVGLFVVAVLFAQYMKQRHEQTTIRLLGGAQYNPRQLGGGRVLIAQPQRRGEIIRHE